MKYREAEGWKHLQDQSNQEWKSHSQSWGQQSRDRKRSRHCFCNIDFICFHRPRSTPLWTDKMQRLRIATCVSILRSQSFPPSLFFISSLRSRFPSIPQMIEIACFPFRSILYFLHFLYFFYFLDLILIAIFFQLF